MKPFHLLQLAAICLVSDLFADVAPPDDAIQFKSNFYKVFQLPSVNWEEAHEKATEMGGALLSVESASELKFIEGLELNLGSSYWIGIFERRSRGVSYDKPWDREVWRSGRPNFWEIKRPSDLKTEDLPFVGCVSIVSGEGSMAFRGSKDVEFVGGFIVEWEKQIGSQDYFTATLPDMTKVTIPSGSVVRVLDPSKKMEVASPADPILQGVSVLPEIAEAISGAPGIQLQSKQASVQALLVVDLGEGKSAGATSKLNLTALPTTEKGELSSLRFNQEVGPDMLQALKEVVRYTRIQHGGWPTGHQIEVAFENKYNMKDGPSAAVACALLLDSAISGVPLRDSFAVTGDLNSDGAVQPIGGLSTKIQAAQKSGCKIMALPSENTEDLKDGILLEGLGLVAGIALFSIENFDDAKAVATTLQADPNLDIALTEFAKISELYKKDPGKFAKSIYHPAVRKKLKLISEKSPSLLSAAALLRISDRSFPTRLSLGGSLDWIDETTGDLLRGAREVASAGNSTFQGDGLADSIGNLVAMRQTLDSRCMAYSDAIVDFGRILREYIQNPPAAGNSSRLAVEAINQSIGSVDSEREKILKNAGMMSELIK